MKWSSSQMDQRGICQCFLVVSAAATIVPLLAKVNSLTKLFDQH